MELVLFVCLAILAYIAMLTDSNTVVYSWFVLFIFYSIVVRLMPMTHDIVHYASAFGSWPPPFSLYTLREPVVWFGGRILHLFLGNDIATFVAIDVIMVSILLVALKSSGSRRNLLFSLAPTIAMSYVFLFGQQNVLRQHVAFLFLLWSTVPQRGFRPRSAMLFVLAVLSHNASIFLAGYWFDMHRRRRLLVGPIITASGVFLLVFLLPFVGKSAAATGLDTRIHYAGVLVFFTLLLLYTNSGRLVFYRTCAWWNFVAFMPAALVLSSASFERIAMMFLVLLAVGVYSNHRTLGLRRTIAGGIAYSVLVLPVFFFPSALRFLIT